MSNSTNYAVPSAMTTINLTSTANWTGFLAPSSATGPNGDSASISYDSIARPQSSVSQARCRVLKSVVPVPRPHCQQITGVVWAGSWRRAIREGIFHDSLFPIWAAGTENVSFLKPVSLGLRPVEFGHRLSNMLFAIHPPAQFLGSGLVNSFDLIFITVVVRHVVSP